MDNFTKIECCACGVLFAISKTFQSNLSETKKSFWCPNGHKQSYNQSEADRLNKIIDQKNAKLGRREDEIFELEKENRKLKKNTVKKIKGNKKKKS